MKSYTDKEILERVEGLESFKGWKDGIYAISIRSKVDAFDIFDDKIFIYEVKDNVPDFVMRGLVTTNAGSYGLLHFDQYNHLGCAVVCPDIITYDSHVWGYHHHIVNAEHEAYVQAEGVPYTRDNNKNQRAENYGEVYNDPIGYNYHHAGLNSTVIKNWSTACVAWAVRQTFNQFKEFMRGKGKPGLSTCILSEF